MTEHPHRPVGGPNLAPPTHVDWRQSRSWLSLTGSSPPREREQPPSSVALGSSLPDRRQVDDGDGGVLDALATGLLGFRGRLAARTLRSSGSARPAPRAADHRAADQRTGRYDPLVFFAAFFFGVVLVLAVLFVAPAGCLAECFLADF